MTIKIKVNGKWTEVSGGLGKGQFVDWGKIGGTLENQTDLTSVLNSKLNIVGPVVKYASNIAKGQARNVYLSESNPVNEGIDGDVWMNYSDNSPSLKVKVGGAWKDVGSKTKVEQTATGIKISDVELQDATSSKDGLMTKEHVAAINSNTSNVAAIKEKDKEQDDLIAGLDTRVGSAEQSIESLVAKEGVQDTAITNLQEKDKAQDIAITSAKNVADAALPIAGGTMTGPITLGTSGASVSNTGDIKAVSIGFTSSPSSEATTTNVAVLDSTNSIKSRTSAQIKADLGINAKAEQSALDDTNSKLSTVESTANSASSKASANAAEIVTIKAKDVEQDTAISKKAESSTVSSNFGKSVTGFEIVQGADRPKINIIKGDNGVTIANQFPIVGEGSKDIAGAVTKTMWDSKADKSQLADYVPRAISDKIQTKTTVEGSEAVVNIVSDYVTLADGTTSSVKTPIPLANGNQAGLILSTDYETIAQNKSDIEALKGRSLRYPVNIVKEKPTSQELSEIYGAIVPTPPIPAIDGTTLVDLTHNKEYTWYTSKDAWIDRGFTVASVATNSTLGIVKGTPNTDGKIFVETDGTMSVKGWDAAKAAISNNDSAIKAHIATKTGNPHNVTATDVGLGNVNNTSDANKPISTATQSALNAKLDDSQLITSWGGTASNSKIPSEKLVKDALDNKQEKGDYQPAGNYATTEALAQVKTTADNAVPKTRKINKKALDADITLTPSDVGALPVGGKAVDATKADSATKATQDGAGDVITTKYATKTELNTGLGKKQDSGDYATNSALDSGLAGKLDDSQLVTVWDSVPSDSKIPSEKLVKAALDGKQAAGNYVPTSRKVAGKALTGDITLIPSDIGAQPSGDYATNDDLSKGLATKLGKSENAVSATKATNDGNNQNIVNTYATKTALNGVNTTATAAMPKSGGTFTGPITINGGDDKGIILPENANINTSGIRTVLGFLNSDFIISHPDFNVKMRGKATNPSYNDALLALKSDIPDVSIYATTVALNQGLATKLGKSENAVSATKATQDGNGAVITSTYATKSELPDITGKLDKTGGTMTGKLTVGKASMDTNGYVESTWFKTTSVARLGNVPDKIAVIDPSGWVYYNDKAQMKEALGVNAKADTSALTNGLATKLGKSENAVSATKATQDGQGRVIATTYATRGEIPNVDGKLDKSGGAMTSQLADVKAKQVRNVIYSVTEPPNLADGDIWVSPGGLPSANGVNF